MFQLTSLDGIPEFAHTHCVKAKNDFFFFCKYSHRHRRNLSRATVVEDLEILLLKRATAHPFRLQQLQQLPRNHQRQQLANDELVNDRRFAGCWTVTTSSR